MVKNVCKRFGIALLEMDAVVLLFYACKRLLPIQMKMICLGVVDFRQSVLICSLADSSAKGCRCFALLGKIGWYGVIKAT